MSECGCMIVALLCIVCFLTEELNIIRWNRDTTFPAILVPTSPHPSWIDAPDYGSPSSAAVGDGPNSPLGLRAEDIIVKSKACFFPYNEEYSFMNE